LSLLVIIGSGETAPTMVKLHRQVFAQTAAAVPGAQAGDAVPAVMLDTPFGFQMNADDLVERTQAYFADSVGTKVEVARWRRADAAVLEQEQALAALGRSGWAFAGPGSPTYALRQWIGTPVPAALLEVAERGGTLVFGSAAACTLGTHAIPVYEIYKVGEEPRWQPALDLLGSLTGLSAVVVPHFDNNEGGNHDTRFCYLGEQRLARLEADLPEPTGVLGVDEHTAALIDLPSRQVRVAGTGRMTVRRRGVNSVFAAGETVHLDTLDALLRGRTGPGSGPAASTAPSSSGTEPNPQQATDSDPKPASLFGDDAGPATSLKSEAAAQQRRFDQALARRDVDTCVAAALDLESAIVAWSADTAQNDEADQARRVLRAMLVRLGELARTGARDPAEVVGGYVETLLQLRARARTGKDFAASDLIRDRLVELGVEVRDTPDGAQWLLRDTTD
jgi:cyanophycinase-like exopeptidase